jgi:hypothetical protein
MIEPAMNDNEKRDRTPDPIAPLPPVTPGCARSAPLRLGSVGEGRHVR